MKWNEIRGKLLNTNGDLKKGGKTIAVEVVFRSLGSWTINWWWVYATLDYFNFETNDKSLF